MLAALRRELHTSAMKLDPAVVKLLSLDPSNTSVSSYGGGGMSSASTSKITTKLNDGTEKSFFMKTGKGKDAEIMFQGPQPPNASSSSRQARLTFSNQANTPP